MYQLDNGLRVVTINVPHLHTANISVYVGVGSRHESSEENGLSHFIEHMFFRGCEGFTDSTQLNAAMENLGGTLDGFTTRDHTSYQTTVHPEHVVDATEILGQMLTRPNFKEIDLERSIILEEMLDSLDDRGRVIELDSIAYAHAYAPHPLGQSIEGSRRNLRRFVMSDLLRHQHRFYTAKNMVLCFCGKIDERRCLQAARKWFAKIPTGKKVAVQPPRLNPPKSPLRYMFTDDPQTRVRLSFHAVSDQHPDFVPLHVLRRVLDGGLSARLQDELVERRGIAYYIGAIFDTYVDCGLFQFEFAVAHPKFCYALEELGKVILKLLQEPVPEDERLQVAKRARFGLEFALDSTAELANWFGATQLFHQPPTPEVRMQQFEEVDSACLQAVARKYFRPEHLSVAAVGGADPAIIREARLALKKFRLNLH